MSGIMIKKNKLFKLLNLLTLLAFMFTMVFGATPKACASTVLSDIEGHWAQGTIQDMVDEGIIGGYPDGTFKPNNNITRAEFASLIVRAFNLKSDSGKVFNDTANHWAKGAISTANYYGLVNGYSDSVFGPDDPVTREQIAVMIVNATKVDSTEEVKTFTDSAKIAAWAKEPVAKATAAGLIAGYPDGTFRPKANATRAEAAVILDRGRKLTEKEVLVTKYDRTGTYGPESGTQTIDGDVTISADGVILRNILIKGNLIISEAVGDGDVTLKNVTVKGSTYIRGGGKDSIHINGGQYNNIIIESTPGGNVRLVATNAEGIQVVISENAAGEEIILEGTFESVVINADNVVLSTRGETTINNLKVHENLTGTTIDIDKNTTVKELVLDSVTEVNNAKGTVKKISGDKLSGSRLSNPPKDEIPSNGSSDGDDSGSSTVGVSAISVAPKTMILGAGATGTITATVEPDNATNKTVTWTSSDVDVATVANGVVTAKSAGIATITATAGSKTATCEVNVYGESSAGDFDFNEGTKTITGYKGSGGVVVIPSKINGVEVETIGEEAFYKYDEEKCETSPNNITSIIIPNTVTSIGIFAFYDCTDLTSIAIPNSVTIIGEGAFCACESLTSITIPNTVTSIGDGAFCACESLKSITFQETSRVESIGECAFEDCSSLESVTIPASVKSIGEEVFMGCSELQAINVDTSNTVYSSAGGALYNKDKSTLLICPSGKTGSFEIPNSVITIGDYAFYECTGLTSITFQEISRVESIGSYAFCECTGLTSITIPNSVKSIGESAFSGCTSLQNMTIPNSVTSIGDWAFARSGLTSITIPNSITSIANNTFKKCIDLTSVIFQENSSVKSIGQSAFADSGLTSITIPNSVDNISSHAFYECTGLTSITISNSVENIGTHTFYKCKSLESVIIPESVTNVEDNAFYECSNLSTVYFYGDAPTMGSWVFTGAKFGFKVYYLSGKTGFTTPKWNGYSSALFLDNDEATLGLVGTTVTSSAEEVSKGEFSTDQSKIHIMPIDTGTATITVKNAESHEATIGVKVTDAKAITIEEITKYGEADSDATTIAVVSGKEAVVTEVVNNEGSEH